jgi:hypothetical protein
MSAEVGSTDGIMHPGRKSLGINTGIGLKTIEMELPKFTGHFHAKSSSCFQLLMLVVPPPFQFIWAQVPECRMSPAPIVKHLNVFEDGVLEFSSRWPTVYARAIQFAV